MPISISAEPVDALVDVPVEIAVSGLAPGEPVSVEAFTRDHAGVDFRSQARFVANEDGSVQLSAQAPVEGDYAGVEAMGMIWAMHPDQPVGFTRAGTASLQFRFVVDGGEASASAEVTRLWMAADVRRTEVRADGLAGVLFEPADAPRGTVAVLSGSGGGLDESVPALLASRGFAALALPYFAYEDLPAHLASIPLEYFDRAFDWLAHRLDGVGERLAVMGTSRGGELALLLGATFPRVRAVVARVPSHVSWGAIPPGEGPSWTLAGRPVAWIETRRDRVGQEEPIALTPGFVAALDDRAAEEQARIAVEQINGGVLLISGSDDQMWPSALMAERVEERLQAKGFAHRCQHLRCEGAGHMIGPPNLPATAPPSRHPQRGQIFSFGGDAQSYARAAVRGWATTLDFLEESLS